MKFKHSLYRVAREAELLLSPLVMLAVLVYLITIAVISDGVIGWINQYAAVGKGPQTLLLIVVTTTWLRRQGRAINVGFAQSIPHPESGLMVFLSKADDAGDFLSWVQAALPGPADATRTVKNGLETAAKADARIQRHSWFMPLTAVAHHEPRLHSLAVMTSPQSSPHLTQFAEVLRALGATRLALQEQRIEDVEDAELVAAGIARGIQWFHGRGIGDAHYLLDITGGIKIGGAVAAIVALEAGRRFQYVSTRGYAVKVYNPTYLIE